MNISQFPERFRARVLSSIVRHNREGIFIRFGKLEGDTLPLSVQQQTSEQILPPAELEQRARAAFANLPYNLRIETELNAASTSLE